MTTAGFQVLSGSKFERKVGWRPCEGEAFEIGCGDVLLKYDVGDKYFVVKHYERVSVGTEHLPQDVYSHQRVKEFHNHLVIHYHVFHMGLTYRLGHAGGTQ